MSKSTTAQMRFDATRRQPKQLFYNESSDSDSVSIKETMECLDKEATFISQTFESSISETTLSPSELLSPKPPVVGGNRRKRLSSTLLRSILQDRWLGHDTDRRRALTLDDKAAAATLTALARRYGRSSHMGVLDRSYLFYLSHAQDAAISFKVKHSIAVVLGDPLCEPARYSAVLAEFKQYRKRCGWGIAFVAVSDDFAKYARGLNWATMQFGVEKVLNPMTNPVLLKSCCKRMITRNNWLLHAKKGGLKVEMYDPAVEEDTELQRQLINVYDTWRDQRKQSNMMQSYITVYDPFALPALMKYLYTTDRNGKPNGFAALRALGSKDGYLLDPYIAAPGAPAGITDLLITAAMALVKKEGLSYLSLGLEASDDLVNITGMPNLAADLAKVQHRQMFDVLALNGRRQYHDKFRPDALLQSSLHLVFPSSIPGPRQVVAVLHVANISLYRVLSRKLDAQRQKSSNSVATPGGRTK